MKKGEKYKRPNTIVSSSIGHILQKGGKRFRNYYSLVQVISNGKITKVEEKELDRADKSREIIELEDYEVVLKEIKLQAEARAIRTRGIITMEFQLKRPHLTGENFNYIVEEKKGGKVISSIDHVAPEKAVKTYFDLAANRI